ncbi:ribose-5-phosphate isomerase [Parenemella sanctibonifatiensis]|uniref:Ribose-5-phosphate isomerase B n=1 Tax=Parenemella sanctibonifatiensis TaxID=2016505 RepID=A0A255EI31_9ACTN|nr:ribose-5-phosphate isomerase [Parenemella sanctibonifatiensis]OYN87793.1 ribose-5-phosphate isomerase [Parenemella sanctibonifatiensis]OYN92100.1 ribose-5-phosphate isomerase [Parenemella sanctibonifatiensis]
MRVHIATDHAAFEEKKALVERLQQAGHDVVDHGAHEYDAEDDYPDFIIPCAEAVVGEPGSLGIVLGGSGNGEQIAANKVTGVRAALAYNTELAKLSREHNNANVLSLGGRMNSIDECWAMVEVFLATEFAGVARHQRRIDKMAAYEASRPGQAS